MEICADKWKAKDNIQAAVRNKRPRRDATHSLWQHLSDSSRSDSSLVLDYYQLLLVVVWGRLFRGKNYVSTQGRVSAFISQVKNYKLPLFSDHYCLLNLKALFFTIGLEHFPLITDISSLVHWQRRMSVTSVISWTICHLKTQYRKIICYLSSAQSWRCSKIFSQNE